MNKTFFAGVGIICMLLFNACKPIQPVTVSKAEGVNISKSDDKKILVEINLRVKNPNAIGFNVYKSEVDININGKDVGKARLKDKVHIKANSDDVHTFILETDMSKLLSGGISALVSFLSSKSVTLGAKGELKVGKLFYKKIFPVNVNEKIPLGSRN